MTLHYTKQTAGSHTRKVWREISPAEWDNMGEAQRDILIRREGDAYKLRLVAFVRQEACEYHGEITR